MKRVLVTHADEPIGRRIVKTLYHDPEVERIFEWISPGTRVEIRD